MEPEHGAGVDHVAIPCRILRHTGVPVVGVGQVDLTGHGGILQIRSLCVLRSQYKLHVEGLALGGLQRTLELVNTKAAPLGIGHGHRDVVGGIRLDLVNQEAVAQDLMVVPDDPALLFLVDDIDPVPFLVHAPPGDGGSDRGGILDLRVVDVLVVVGPAEGDVDLSAVGLGHHREVARTVDKLGHEGLGMALGRQVILCTFVGGGSMDVVRGPVTAVLRRRAFHVATGELHVEPVLAVLAVRQRKTGQCARLVRYPRRIVGHAEHFHVNVIGLQNGGVVIGLVRRVQGGHHDALDLFGDPLYHLALGVVPAHIRRLVEEAGDRDGLGLRGPGLILIGDLLLALLQCRHQGVHRVLGGRLVVRVKAHLLRLDGELGVEVEACRIVMHPGQEKTEVAPELAVRTVQILQRARLGRRQGAHVYKVVLHVVLIERYVVRVGAFRFGQQVRILGKPCIGRGLGHLVILGLTVRGLGLAPAGRGGQLVQGGHTPDQGIQLFIDILNSLQAGQKDGKVLSSRVLGQHALRGKLVLLEGDEFTGVDAQLVGRHILVPVQGVQKGVHIFHRFGTAEIHFSGGASTAAPLHRRLARRIQIDDHAIIYHRSAATLDNPGQVAGVTIDKAGTVDKQTVGNISVGIYSAENRTLIVYCAIIPTSGEDAVGDNPACHNICNYIFRTISKRAGGQIQRTGIDHAVVDLAVYLFHKSISG